MNIESRRYTDRSLLLECWGRLLKRGETAALVGYPDQWNVGDAAIWRGARILLQSLDVKITYTSDAWSYDPRALEKAVPSGPVLLIGGGNFGDVYVNEATLRERVLTDFPDRRIIQLPQSTWFLDPANIERMRDMLNQHRAFILLARDRNSLAFARDHLPCESLLCPDTALGLPEPPVYIRPQSPVLAIWRHDVESRDWALPAPSNWCVRDWIEPGPENQHWPLPVQAFQHWVGQPLHHVEYPPSWRREWAWRWAPSAWERLADARIERGYRMLQAGRVVITNRLHAHLLCVLMGKPHVVCDTVNGKISAYRKTWPLTDERVMWANSPEEAVERAAQWLERAR